MLTASFVRECALKCADEGLAYLAIHCHGGERTVSFSSDDLAYGGSGLGAWGAVPTHPVPAHGWPGSIVVTLPPLGVLVLEAESA